MSSNNTVYGKYEDANGEEYYCPFNHTEEGDTALERELDNCVEASTAGRYAGNIDVLDRFPA